VLLRCTQEIITNVVRHAQATALDLDYQWRDQGIRLQARDNGRGADSPATGNGLRGMRERLVAYGGEVDIETQPGNGFCLTVFLPVPQTLDRMGLPMQIARGQVGKPPLTEAAA
jgi:signal transduction histidine kinase